MSPPSPPTGSSTFAPASEARPHTVARRVGPRLQTRLSPKGAASFSPGSAEPKRGDPGLRQAARKAKPALRRICRLPAASVKSSVARLRTTPPPQHKPLTAQPQPDLPKADPKRRHKPSSGESSSQPAEPLTPKISHTDRDANAPQQPQHHRREITLFDHKARDQPNRPANKHRCRKTAVEDKLDGIQSIEQSPQPFHRFGKLGIHFFPRTSFTNSSIRSIAFAIRSGAVA